MARDRTARGRIRRELAEHGPVEDPHGLATKRLKDAVGYGGSPVAFIQLIAAMERDGELEREIRGKRTYRIAVAEPGSRPEVVATRDPTAVLDTDSGRLAVDYDLLARSLLRELTAPAVRGEIRAENRRIAEERDEYARRLGVARAELEELRDSAQRPRSLNRD